MRVAVLADIHSNLEALEAVFKDMGPSASLRMKSRGDKGGVGPAKFAGAHRGVSEIWCLGDVVGYGPEPNACCELIEKRTKDCVLGNHDAGVLGRLDLSWFNSFAAEAIEITRKIIKKKHRNFLVSLPEIEKLCELILLHGSVKNPLTEYIFETHQAEQNFENFSEKICFVGHTHYPVVFEKDGELIREMVPHFQKKVKLKKGCRYIINPGSVGQPRDGDWRASYGIFDDEGLCFEFRRVEYDIEKTQRRMRKLDLPEFLIQRLTLGR